MFSSEEIKSFQELWQRKFGKEISREFAISQATSLITLMKNTYKPMTKEKFKKFKINN